MKRRNKFGIVPEDGPEDGVEVSPDNRERRPGPMGAAIRDTAENLQAATDEKVEQRRRNANDAKEYREAVVQGRLLLVLPIADVLTDDLPRDRLELETVATSDEMQELKTSIRTRGQREAIEVYEDGKGAYQLKSGWRRLNALRQLHEETGDEAFATVKARISEAGEARLARYIDMVEENVIREDLTFAEMAQLAINAAEDPLFEGSDPVVIASQLYASMHKVKRSYVRSFVMLLQMVGEDLQWPKAISRNLGVDVARALKADPVNLQDLKDALKSVRSPEDQEAVLRSIVEASSEPSVPAPKRSPREKFEFHLDELKITARHGECRIVGKMDFTELPRDQLERAIAAFHKVLKG